MKVLILLAAFTLAACNIHYSSGERAGTVLKFSEKGLIWKTHEGQMLLGGMKNVSDSHGVQSVAANTWEFTVSDPGILKQLESALDSGSRVKVQYEQYLLPWINQTDTGYFITKVLEN